MTAPKFAIASPAKINLYLTVKDKRPDGFHNLESIFYAVEFGDTLYFEPISAANSVDIVMKWKNLHNFSNFDISIKENIIFRALFLFRNKTGYDQGLMITVEKCIPPGGGLGGGSSNAASTLLALNKLAGYPLSREILLETAASLGSDVPFFVHEAAGALVTGRGENIKPITPPRCFLVLVNPGFPSDTAAAFRLLDKKRTEKVSDTFLNDFLAVFKDPEKSVYNGIISSLREQGAGFAGLSGAGSTCFGIFEEKTQAEKAAAAMRKVWPFAECTSTVS